VGEPILSRPVAVATPAAETETHSLSQGRPSLTHPTSRHSMKGYATHAVYLAAGN
jgi:hypothetical protein